MDWTPGLRGFNQNGVRKRFRKKKRIQSTHSHNPVDKIPGIRLGAGRKQISYGHVVVYASAAAAVVVVSSDRSSCSDDGLLYIHPRSGNFFRFSLSPLMQLMLQVSL